MVSDDDTELDRSLYEEIALIRELHCRLAGDTVQPLESSELNALNDLAHVIFQMLIYDVRFLQLSYEDTVNQTVDTMADIMYHLRGILNNLLIAANPSYNDVSLARFEDAFDNIKTCRQKNPTLDARWCQSIVGMSDPEFLSFLDAFVGAHEHISYWADETEQLLLFIEVNAYYRFFIKDMGFQREQRRLRFIFLALFRCTAYCQNLYIVPWHLPADVLPIRIRFENYFLKFIKDIRMTDPQEQVLISMIQRAFVRPGETEYFEMCYPNDRASAPAMLVAFRPKEEIDGMTDLLDMPLHEMYEKASNAVRFCVMRLMLEVVFLLNTPLDFNECILDNPDLDVLHSTDVAVVKIVNTYVVLSGCQFYFPRQDPMDVFFTFFWCVLHENNNKLENYDMSQVTRLWHSVVN